VINTKKNENLAGASRRESSPENRKARQTMGSSVERTI
jgi:hypothetical protein